jgi:hypothetical protein
VVIGTTVPTLIVIVFFGYLAWRHGQASSDPSGGGSRKVVRPEASNNLVEPERRILADRQGPSPTPDQEPARDLSAGADDAAKSRIDAAPTRDSAENDSQTPPMFLLGAEAVVHINGDEVRRVPGLGKSGIVKDDSIVLVFPWEEYASYQDAMNSAFSP